MELLLTHPCFSLILFQGKWAWNISLISTPLLFSHSSALSGWRSQWSCGWKMENVEKYSPGTSCVGCSDRNCEKPETQKLICCEFIRSGNNCVCVFLSEFNPCDQCEFDTPRDWNLPSVRRIAGQASLPIALPIWFGYMDTCPVGTGLRPPTPFTQTTYWQNFLSAPLICGGFQLASWCQQEPSGVYAILYLSTGRNASLGENGLLCLRPLSEVRSPSSK